MLKIIFFLQGQSPFLFQQCPLLLYHLSRALAMKAAEGAIGGNDAVAGHFGGEGITLEGLSDGLGTSTTDASGKFTISDSLATRDTKQFQIHTTLELCDVGGCEDPMADVGHDGIKSDGSRRCSAKGGQP